MSKINIQVQVPLAKFNKIDEGNGITLWQSVFVAPYSMGSSNSYYWPYIDSSLDVDVRIYEAQFKEAVYKEFSDIVSENKIMCGVSNVDKYNPFYFIRLFLTEEQNGPFILKYLEQPTILEIKVEI